VYSSSQNFLRDLLKEAKKINDVSEDKLIEYTDTMVSRVYYDILWFKTGCKW
jgi:hypothetical protein